MFSWESGGGAVEAQTKGHFQRYWVSHFSSRVGGTVGDTTTLPRQLCHSRATVTDVAAFAETAAASVATAFPSPAPGISLLFLPLDPLRGRGY